MEIVSTGGTAKLLREAGLTVRDVADLTGWPEMLGGRVKTLHPKVHGGILFRRGRADDREQIGKHGIAPVDLVVVNLYPFEATAARPDLTVDELIENIDIGGPAMVRSAAKNFESVAVVTDPADYPALAKELAESGDFSLATRLDLARKAFAATARYDGTHRDRTGAVDDHRRQSNARREALASRASAYRAGATRGAALRRESAPEGGAVYSRGANSFGLAGATQLQGQGTCLTTTWWIWTPPGDWRRNLRGPRR